MEALVRALELCREVGEPCVVATIVHVEGSAYRREGARCLIRLSGEVEGILSGGCIEEDLRAHAEAVFKSGIPETVEYDFRGAADELWGSGLGCNGAVTIWLELFDAARFPKQAESLLADLNGRLSADAAYEAVTVLACDMQDTQHMQDTQEMQHMLDEQATEPVVPGKRFKRAAGASRAQLAGRRAGRITARLGDCAAQLLIEQVEPRPELLLVGVGDDARVLCALARSLGWRVRVVYHETARLTRERFAAAEALTIVPRLAFASANPAGTYAVVMTHHMELDREAVGQLLLGGAHYVGLVGSAYRRERILEGLRESLPQAEHVQLEALLPERFYSPVGLDIGAETAEEIALSIMAELMAVHKKHGGGFLRDRKHRLGSGSSNGAMDQLHGFPASLQESYAHV